eukprot:scaffold66739_cov32-Tisochrysis_lutea.AAC.8
MAIGIIDSGRCHIGTGVWHGEAVRTDLWGTPTIRSTQDCVDNRVIHHVAVRVRDASKLEVGGIRAIKRNAGNDDRLPRFLARGHAVNVIAMADAHQRLCARLHRGRKDKSRTRDGVVRGRAQAEHAVHKLQGPTRARQQRAQHQAQRTDHLAGCALTRGASERSSAG